MTVTPNQELTERVGELANGLEELLSQINGQLHQETAATLNEAMDLLYQLKREGVFTLRLA